MAICPFAVQQIIPESHTQGAIRPTTLIFHRAVSSAESLQAYWNSPGVELESHFYIGQHGVIYQFMDTGIRADANVQANAFAISVETWDGGNTPDSMGWNDKQLAAAKRLAAWVCQTHGIRRAAATSWAGGGIGGHNWFPTEWAGGPRGCPGTERNRQIRQEIIPYVAGGGGTDLEDDDMQLTDRMENQFGTMPTVQQVFAAIDYNTVINGQKLDALTKLVGAIAKDPALSPARAEQIVRDAVTKSNTEALAAQQAQLNSMLALVREIIAARDENLADEVVDEIARRTTRSDPA